MRRRRSFTSFLAFCAVLPVLTTSQTYDAVPIGRPFLRPPPSPRQESDAPPATSSSFQRQQVPRGYQPPPRLANFNPPRSYPTFRQPTLNLDTRPSPPHFNWQMQQLQQQHPQRFATAVQRPPVQQMVPSLPHNHFQAGAPGQVPQFHTPQIRIPTASAQRKQTQVLPAELMQNGQLDPVNNIIIHLYLNSKDRMSHAEIKTPVRGLFGIGTSHGGPGTHSDPIIITKDFDRDTLEFVGEGQMPSGRSSNIIEVKATVSTPNRQLETTVNKAVNEELDKAIPKVMDRMRGSTMTMDNGMRKELEEALVDELAKNLGETIDNTDVTEEDLSRLIEERFEEVNRQHETTTRTPTVVVTRPTTTTTTTRRPTSITTTTRRPTTTTSSTTTTTTTEWSNLVTEASNDDDYFTEESEDISETSPPTTTTTTTTRRTVIITSPSTTTTRVWTTTTPSPMTRATGGHVHVMPGIRVTEVPTTTTTTMATTTTARVTEASSTTTTTMATTTTTARVTEAPSTTTTTARVTEVPSTTTTTTTTSTTTPRPTTTTSLLPPYRPPTSIVTFSPESVEPEDVPRVSTIPTRTPLIEVSPSVVPHRGVVNLESNEEDVDYTRTVTSQPVSMFTTRSSSSTALQNLPTKASFVPTIHPSTFSPPLVTTDTDVVTDVTDPFTFTAEPSVTSSTSTISTTTTTPSPTSPEDVASPKIEVAPHTKYTEEPFFSTSSIEWIPGTSTEECEEDVVTTTTQMPGVMITDEDYDYTNDFSLHHHHRHYSTSTTSTTTTKPSKSTSSEEIQPNFVIPQGPCPTPNRPGVDRNRTDVLFLLDSSDAFNEHKFHRAIQLIGETVGQFENFGPDGVQVSLVQYNEEPYLEFSLRKHNCKKHLLDDIADTEYMTGGSALNRALEKVSQFAFTKKRGDRPDAENVLIIVTDGPSSDRIQQPTRLAKENNVTVLVISSIGADKDYVKELAGNAEHNLFGLEDRGGDVGRELAWKLARRIGELSSSTSSASDSAPPPVVSGSLTPVSPGEDRLEEKDNALVPVRKPDANNNNVEEEGVVNLECVGDGFKIHVSPPDGFRGVVVVKGYQDDARCKATASSSSADGGDVVSLFIANDECGVTQVKSFEPRGVNSSLVIHLLHDKELNTGEDRAYLLQCFIGTPDDAEVSTNLDVVRSELAIAETISLSTLPPTCTYSIRRDGPDGSIVTSAVVGQTVYHRWDCDGTNETSNAYGIQVHSCYASDDVERKFAFVDPHGCSSDLALLTDLTYADDSLTAWAASHVFSVHNADSLKFVCKLSLCTRDGDGCEGVTPPACGSSSNKTGLLLTKRLIKAGQNAVDEALTSALTTKVGVSTRSVDGMEGFLKSLASSYAFWIVAIVAVAAIVAISVLTRNLAEGSETATTCSDPSDSQDFGSIRSEDHLSVHSGAGAPNERLADFMRTFDRNRYV